MVKKISMTGFIFSLSFAFAGHSCNNAKQAVDTKAALKIECKESSHCILAKADCCGCSKGGTQKAITLVQAKEDAAKKALECKSIMCAQVISKDPSCQKKAACVNGKCELQ